MKPATGRLWIHAVTRVVLIGAALFCWVSLSVAKPVVMEVFVRGDGCAACTNALEAVQTLRTTFSDQEAHILVYTLDDPALPFTALSRARSYNITPNSTLPVAIFDGIAQVSGANRGVISTYTRNINNRLPVPVTEQLEAEVRFESGSMIAAVTTVLQSPASAFNFYAALSRNPLNRPPARVVNFRTESILPFQEIAFTLDPDVPRHEFRLTLILQERTTGTIVNSVHLPQPFPVRFDLDNDGDIDGIDLLLLSRQWRRTNQPADFNRDGFVNALDLIAFWGVRR